MCYGEIISDTILQSKRGVRCSECREKIAPGQEYRKTVQKDGPEILDTRLCVSCHAAVEVVKDERGDACYMLGEVHSTLSEVAHDGGWKALRARLRAARTTGWDSVREYLGS